MQTTTGRGWLGSWISRSVGFISSVHINTLTQARGEDLRTEGKAAPMGLRHMWEGVRPQLPPHSVPLPAHCLIEPQDLSLTEEVWDSQQGTDLPAPLCCWSRPP
jgi:hypothetical protein